jgi:hypothetical protein
VLSVDTGRIDGPDADRDRGDVVSTMERWIMAVCADLGLDPGSVDARAVLDMARDVAHNVDRPAAPVTAYLLGMAVGRGMAPSRAARQVSALAVAWPGREEEG